MNDHIIDQSNELEEAEGVVAAWVAPDFKTLHLNGQRLLMVPETTTDKELEAYCLPSQRISRIYRTETTINLVTETAGPTGQLVSCLEDDRYKVMAGPAESEIPNVKVI
jgi:hypothetical protein